MKHRRSFNTPQDFVNTPFNNLRSQLYPLWPARAEQGVGQWIAGDKFPSTWLPRDVNYGRAPSGAGGAIEAQQLQNALLAATNKKRLTIEQAAILQRARALQQYYVPKDVPREHPKGPQIQGVPFIPRHKLPPEAIKVQAALNNPLTVPGVYVSEPQVNDIRDQLRRDRRHMYRRFGG